MIALLLTNLFLFSIASIKGHPTAYIRCGKAPAKPDLRILGGNPVKPNSWPWMVSLFTGNEEDFVTRSGRRGHSCGGVLINREWVLTAAHCLDDKNNSNVFPLRPPQHWRLTAGMNYRIVNSTESEMWQTKKVRRFLYHRNFQDLRNSAINDIAAIQAKTPFVFNSYVYPICLPMGTKTRERQRGCFAAGWGTLSENSVAFSVPLQEVDVPIVNSTLCELRYKGHFHSDQHICAGVWKSGGRDTCRGDSGGPLACKRFNKRWYLAGITSWGTGCGQPLTPGVYTNVLFFERWVQYILIGLGGENPLLLRNGRIQNSWATK